MSNFVQVGTIEPQEYSITTTPNPDGIIWVVDGGKIYELKRGEVYENRPTESPRQAQ